jgi:hypothetical protein
MMYRTPPFAEIKQFLFPNALNVMHMHLHYFSGFTFTLLGLIPSVGLVTKFWVYATATALVHFSFPFKFLSHNKVKDRRVSTTAATTVEKITSKCSSKNSNACIQSSNALQSWLLGTGGISSLVECRKNMN